ncbi:MAG: sigma-70 family RNA polymerase sigma factor [Candidatus Peribacteria bacterium]|jgi:RNA polymerase sigma factor (sigma-70 family)|nr:sigma-70 family RNA polymerase sigma factor [Candidatus Peribacteria bacterium]
MVIDFAFQFKQLLIAQDEPTFSDFYQETVDIFYRYLKANYTLSPQECDDIIADFYVKCRNALPKYDVQQNFSGYLWSIFKNNLKDFWKKREDLVFSAIGDGEGEDSFADQLADPEDFTEILQTEFSFEQIQAAMRQLDSMSQDVVFLKFIQEKEYGEIAGILGISQESARQKCSRALKHLKILIENI